jgi:hypothetical protein
LFFRACRFVLFLLFAMPLSYFGVFSFHCFIASNLLNSFITWWLYLHCSFIDAELLQQETNKLDATLTEHERMCNTLKPKAALYLFDAYLNPYKFPSLMTTMFADILNVCFFFSSF